jgi:hypothetical protein
VCNVHERVVSGCPEVPGRLGAIDWVYADGSGADVPQEQKAGWTSFLKSLAQMTGDLSSMTAPPCRSRRGSRSANAYASQVILSPISLTEFPAYWCEHPLLFASISEGGTEEDRMERVLRWFIGTLKGQYTVSEASSVS